MKFRSKPLNILFLAIFCLVGLEIQTVLLPIKASETALTPPACFGHDCACKHGGDGGNLCCCCSKISLSETPIQTGVYYFVKTLQCRGVHTDIPLGHLTQYEPLINKAIEYTLLCSGTLPLERAKKPSEPYLSPPYKPPEIPS